MAWARSDYTGKASCIDRGQTALVDSERFLELQTHCFLGERGKVRMQIAVGRDLKKRILG